MNRNAPGSRDALVVLHGASKIYRRGDQTVKALDSIDLSTVSRCNGFDLLPRHQADRS